MSTSMYVYLYATILIKMFVASPTQTLLSHKHEQARRFRACANSKRWPHLHQAHMQRTIFTHAMCLDASELGANSVCQRKKHVAAQKLRATFNTRLAARPAGRPHASFDFLFLCNAQPSER